MGSLTDELRDIDLDNFIEALYQGGWYEFIFPFLLVYAIVFTILGKVHIFEDKDKKPIRVVIALIIGLFAIAFPINGDFASCGVNDTIYSSNGCESLGDLMMSVFPGVTAFSIGILGLYIIVAMMGIDLTEFFGRNDDKNDYIKYVLGGIGLFIVVYYYARGFGWEGFDGSDNWLWGEDGILRDPLLYILAIAGGTFFWISKDSKDSDDEDNNIVSKKKSSGDS